MSNTHAKKAIFFSWLWLVTLTFISAYMGLLIEEHSLFIISALASVFFKGQQIIDVFMELKHAPKFWRLLLLTYVVLVPMIIALIYLI